MVALSLGAVYSLIAVGFALIFGILNFSNFSHGVVMACGAFIGFFLIAEYGVHWIPSLLITMVLTGLLALVIEFLAFRKLWTSGAPTIFLFVSSITVLMLIQNILTLMFRGDIWLFPAFMETMTIRMFGATVATTQLLMFGVSIIILVTLTLFLRKTRVGIAITAAATDLKTCALMGVNVTMVIMYVFFISGLIAGATGVFLGMTYTVNPLLGQMVLFGFIATIIGGMGSLGGSVIGGFILGGMQVIFTLTIGSALLPVGQFSLILLFLLLRPHGILGRKIVDKV